MLHQKEVKSVLNKHKKRDSWFLDEYSVNAYEGCSCNCQYCYIRGSKYGENMEQGMMVKTNVLEILERQLAARARKEQYGIVTVGSAIDAYIHQDEERAFTKGILELLLKYRFPAFISTKRLGIRRDIALLKEINRQAILPTDLQGRLKGGVILSVSLSTLDESISDTLEPGASSPMERLGLVKELRIEGFQAGVNAIPLLPFISDTEEGLERIVAAAKEHSADYILTGGLTLFGEGPADSKTLFYKFLERYDASLLPKYYKLYGPNFYTPYDYQQELSARASGFCKKYNIRNAILE